LSPSVAPSQQLRAQRIVNKSGFIDFVGILVIGLL
jgi:hypothetical protein